MKVSIMTLRNASNTMKRVRPYAKDVHETSMLHAQREYEITCMLVHVTHIELGRLTCMIVRVTLMDLGHIDAL